MIIEYIVEIFKIRKENRKSITNFLQIFLSLFKFIWIL